MANLRNTSDLKKLVLQRCGELTDGTSTYDQVALNLLDAAHKKIITGGSEFDIDLSEPWPWARAKYPIIFNLTAPYISGSVTMTQGSFNGIFTSIPAVSLQGRFLKTDNNYDWYIIRQHTAGQASFQIDYPWQGDTGSFTFKAVQLEYELYNDNVIVDEFSSIFEFADTGGVKTATVAQGVYTTADLASALQAALLAAGANSPTVVFNTLTRMFTVGQGGPTFSLRIASAAVPMASGWMNIGFSAQDYAGVTTYTTDGPYQEIDRLVMALTTYGNSNYFYQSAADTGKIYGIDINSLLKAWPLAQINAGIPENFAVTKENMNGSKTVRFNTYPIETPVRIEADYIPAPRDLQDNAASIPLVPKAHRETLVFMAAHYLCLDKSDNKSEEYKNKAIMGLNGLINDFRSQQQLTNNRFGRLIPRLVGGRPWRVFP